MAIVCTNFRGKVNTDVSEIVCDTVDELLSDAPTSTKVGTGKFSEFNHKISLGSTAIVGNNGSTLVFMLFSDGWQPI